MYTLAEGVGDSKDGVTIMKVHWLTAASPLLFPT